MKYKKFLFLFILCLCFFKLDLVSARVILPPINTIPSGRANKYVITCHFTSMNSDGTFKYSSSGSIQGIHMCNVWIPSSTYPSDSYSFTLHNYNGQPNFIYYGNRVANRSDINLNSYITSNNILNYRDLLSNLDLSSRSWSSYSDNVSNYYRAYLDSNNKLYTLDYVLSSSFSSTSFSFILTSNVPVYDTDGVSIVYNPIVEPTYSDNLNDSYEPIKHITLRNKIYDTDSSSFTLRLRDVSSINPKIISSINQYGSASDTDYTITYSKSNFIEDGIRYYVLDINFNYIDSNSNDINHYSYLDINIDDVLYQKDYELFVTNESDVWINYDDIVYEFDSISVPTDMPLTSSYIFYPRNSFISSEYTAGFSLKLKGNTPAIESYLNTRDVISWSQTGFTINNGNFKLLDDYVLNPYTYSFSNSDNLLWFTPFHSSYLPSGYLPCFVLTNNYEVLDNHPITITYNSSLLGASYFVSNGSTGFISSDDIIFNDVIVPNVGSGSSSTGSIGSSISNNANVSGIIYDLDVDLSDISSYVKYGLNYWKDKIKVMFSYIADMFNVFPYKFQMFFITCFMLIVGLILFRLLL